jgi:hypothetical protein
MTIQMCEGCNKPKPREWCWDGRTSGCPFLMPPRYPGTASITCPVCNKTSYNPNDIENGYCGYCHAYTGVVNPQAVAERVIRETHDSTRNLVDRMREADAFGLTVGDPSIPRPETTYRPTEEEYDEQTNL